jgi:hypothetical protein
MDMSIFWVGPERIKNLLGNKKPVERYLSIL